MCISLGFKRGFKDKENTVEITEIQAGGECFYSRAVLRLMNFPKLSLLFLYKHGKNRRDLRKLPIESIFCVSLCPVILFLISFQSTIVFVSVTNKNIIIGFPVKIKTSNFVSC